tara:strand:+ start:327 stop:719 length:393 start_codon:yes stop_codon:yes gene_type:complete
MATLTPTLTLTSSDATSDTLNMTVTDSLSVGPPSVGISKIAIAANGGSDTVLKPSGSAGNHFLYVKHTGKQGDNSTDATAAVVLKLASTSLSVLTPGEFLFMNVINSGVINAISSSSETITVEYAYWTKS